jgi:hypothetical protein
MSKPIGCMDCVEQHPDGEIPCENCPVPQKGSGRWWCRHRTPFTGECTVCRIGIDFRQWGLPVKPCVGESKDCPKYKPLSKLEWYQREQEHNARFERIGRIRHAIMEHFDTTGLDHARIPCPCCETGTVSYSRASYNGHIHATCSSPGCASWME